jgi:hypothetical protein
MRKMIIALCVSGFAASTFAESKANPSSQLINAIYKQDAAQIKAAVKAGANPNGGTYAGHYLGMAATTGYLESVKALVEAGANVNQSTSGGWTAAMAAADNGHLAVLQYLVGKKANLNATTRMGRTILMRAAGHGQTSVVQYLLRRRASVNAVDASGATALMLAAQGGHDKTVKVLLGSGADKSLAASSKKTALIFAQEGAKASGKYREEEFTRTIALLSGAASKSNGKFIGTVYRAKGKYLTISGKGVRAASKGAQIRIKSAGGDVSAVVTQKTASRLRATADKDGVAKGDSVYLD